MKKKYIICKKCGASDSCISVEWTKYRRLKNKFGLLMESNYQTYKESNDRKL